MPQRKKMSNSFQIMEIIYNKINAILKEIVSKLKYQLLHAKCCDLGAAVHALQAPDLRLAVIMEKLRISG